MVYVCFILRFNSYWKLSCWSIFISSALFSLSSYWHWQVFAKLAIQLKKISRVPLIPREFSMGSSQPPSWLPFLFCCTSHLASSRRKGAPLFQEESLPSPPGAALTKRGLQYDLQNLGSILSCFLKLFFLNYFLFFLT